MSDPIGNSRRVNIRIDRMDNWIDMVRLDRLSTTRKHLLRPIYLT